MMRGSIVRKRMTPGLGEVRIKKGRYARAQNQVSNFVNLGNLYSLPPTCGCSAILPSGTRVVFHEKLETKRMIAHMRVVEKFLHQVRRKSDRMPLGLSPYLVEVRRSPTSANSSIGVRVYNQATWVRTPIITPGRQIALLRRRLPLFDLNCVDNDIEKGFDSFMEHPPRKTTKEILWEREEELAQAMRNFRGSWRVPDSDLEAQREPSSTARTQGLESVWPAWETRNEGFHKFTFYELRESSRRDLLKSCGGLLTRLDRRLALPIRRWRTREGLIKYIFNGVNINKPEALETAVISYREVETVPQKSQDSQGSHASTSKGYQTAPETVKNTIQEQPPFLAGMDINKTVPGAQEVKVESSKTSQPPFRASALPLTPSSGLSALPPVQTSEPAIMQKYLEQFESMFGQMKQELRIASLESTITQLQQELYQARTDPSNPGASSNSITQPIVPTAEVAKQADPVSVAPTKESIPPQQADSPEVAPIENVRRSARRSPAPPRRNRREPNSIRAERPNMSAYRNAGAISWRDRLKVDENERRKDVSQLALRYYPTKTSKPTSETSEKSFSGHHQVAVNSPSPEAEKAPRTPVSGTNAEPKKSVPKVTIEPLISSRELRDASDKRIQEMQDELWRLSGQIEGAPQTAAEKASAFKTDATAPTTSTASAQETPELDTKSLREKKDDLWGNTFPNAGRENAWGNTFSKKPSLVSLAKTIEAVSPKLSASASSAAEPKEVPKPEPLSRPSLLSWLSGAVPSRKEKSDESQHAVSR